MRFKGLALQNKAFVADGSVTYTEFVEFNYAKLIYCIVGKPLSKTGESITKWRRYYKVRQALLQFEARVVQRGAGNLVV